MDNMVHGQHGPWTTAAANLCWCNYILSSINKMVITSTMSTIYNIIKKIGHCNKNTGETLLLKTILESN